MPRFQQQQLGEFVRNRRDRLRPGEVGLTAGPRRRAPGLRRDEVAMLANMSTDYYERIEQGRGPQPSPAMLGAIARALRLTLAERDHLYVLAGHHPPEPAVALGYADPGLMTVLDALAPRVPALIADDMHNIVGQNGLNIALLGKLVGEGDVVISPPSGQRLVLFRAAPGTDTHDKLELLGALGTQVIGSSEAETRLP